MSDTTYIPHRYPVWGDKATHLIQIKVPDDEGDLFEQLWAKEVGPKLFEICCIPGFARNLALGDIVETDENYLVQRVRTRSGRVVFRAWSEGGWEAKREILDTIASHDGLMETCTLSLLAIDVPSLEQAIKMRNCLEHLEERRVLEFETGYD